MKKKTQLVTLPTNQKANNCPILYFPKTKRLNVRAYSDEELQAGTGLVKYEYTTNHLYFLSDEPIKEGGWYINNGVLFKADDKFDEGNNPNQNHANKKVIATTDESLIINPEELRFGYDSRSFHLPQPSQEFIQHYVEQYNKGNIIEWVDVEYTWEKTMLYPDLQILKVNPDNTINILLIKDLSYWKANAEEDYMKVPISVLRYISELEKEVKDSWNREEVVEFAKKVERFINKDKSIFTEIPDWWISENLK